MDPREWDHVIHVNLSGAFYASPAVLQHMLDRGYGRVINISSIIGSAGGFGEANYAAAKSGMFGLTMSLALETAGKGITVNTVTPGFITTDMTAAVPADVLAKVVARIPVGRLGEPDEVARVVEFLADPESGGVGWYNAARAVRGRGQGHHGTIDLAKRLDVDLDRGCRRKPGTRWRSASVRRRRQARSPACRGSPTCG
jgi:NAD(P)-dependent dehydrogenase (short-subunit alcohol dehydrogenase family)